MFSLICVQFSFLCAIVLILFYLHGLKDSRNTVFIYHDITGVVFTTGSMVLSRGM